jgi:hypothetical protein
MSARGWLLLAGVAILGSAVTLWSLSQDPRAPAMPPAEAPAAAAPPSPSAAPAIDSAPIARDERAAPAVGAPRSAPAAAGFPQGLRGIVVDEAGRPLAGLPVYLVELAGNDPLALPVLRQQRDALGPVASAESAVDGTFALGLPVAQDKVYELYATSPRHATARVSGLRLLAGEWHDVGAITMTAGASLRGRVTIAGRDDIPVAGALISVEIGTVFGDAALRALPGAGQGLVATADGAGNYELHHVPSRGVVQVSAVAHGFARLRKQNIELRLDEPVVVNFALLPGKSLAGVVQGADGAPIANARLEAWPQQPAGEPSFATSDENGRFDVLGLAAGSYRLRAAARGYEPQEQRELEPGRGDVQFVLHEQGTLRVRVVAPDGTTLRNYRLGLRRSFPEQNDQIAAVVEVPDQRVRLDAATDFAELRGLPTGRFRCQVEAEGFAKTLSDEVVNQREPGTPSGPQQFAITVTMSPGATLRGRVVDDAGRPLAGAVVATQAKGTLPDSPFTRLLAGALPERITATRTSAADDGTFVLPLLALGDYQLLVEHEDACRTTVPDVRLDRVGEHTLPPIVLHAGATISGRALVGGRATGQVQIVLTTLPNVSRRDAMRLETITDASGAWRLPRRVPPGTYELRAAAIGTTEPEAQIFRQLLQLQRSSITVVVAPGQRQVERDIDLPSDH